MDIQNKETATQNEQQSISQENIIIIINVLSDIEKHLSSIAYSLDYFVFDNKRAIDNSHSIPD